MSAQVPPATYLNNYAVTMPPRRQPLSTTAGHNQQPKSTPPKVKDTNKPNEPPLPRQNTKVVPPSPPKIIINADKAQQYMRLNFLGEGGFARVYEVKDTEGVRAACKVVTSASLKTTKAKTKLYAEIKIHRSLEHPNIVTFQDCFVDEENVYMTLELCHNGSLMDLLRRRRRFTNPETRFFMMQLIGACHYMHTHQVIHRDLKLGNIFLDSKMNVKVGDFGLAALIENPGERKKTICGTPNYIAPEVLFDTANGHSFEVDIWSIGVILYTLVVGRPPFQTKEVKEIYTRIRKNEYEFPTDKPVSEDVKALIALILTADPQARPTLHEIIDHAFFIDSTFPPFIPANAYSVIPDFSHISRLASEHNYKQTRRRALLDEDQTTSIAVPKPSSVSRSTSHSRSAASRNPTATIAQQEKEFKKAVQPGSPISALLSSAKQPLLINPATTENGSEPTLLRKLQSVQPKESPLRQSVTAHKNGAGRGLQGILEEDAREGDQAVRRKELESQKARIVAQMVLTKENEGDDPDGHNLVHRARTATTTAKDKGKAVVRDRENMAPSPAKSARTESRRTRDVLAPREPRVQAPVAPRVAPPVAATSEPQQKLGTFEAAARVLTRALEARSNGKLFRNPKDDVQLPKERVFLTSWVDFTHKYGMPYALTDGTIGMRFNDSTSLVLSPDKHHFDYVVARGHGQVFQRKSFDIQQYPEDLKVKVHLLKHFDRYIKENLWRNHDYQFEDTTRSKGMDWVHMWLRVKGVFVFKFSHDAIQFNFPDHVKLVLSSHGLVVTYINYTDDERYELSRWTLSQIMAYSLKPPSDPTDVKFIQDMVDKLKYCQELLVGICAASAQTASTGQETMAASTATTTTTTRRPAEAAPGAPAFRSSKVMLR